MDYSLLALLSRGFSRQKYQSGLPCPPPGDLPKPRIKPVSLMSPIMAVGFFLPLEPPGKPQGHIHFPINQTKTLPGSSSHHTTKEMSWDLLELQTPMDIKTHSVSHLFHSQDDNSVTEKMFQITCSGSVDGLTKCRWQIFMLMSLSLGVKKSSSEGGNFRTVPCPCITWQLQAKDYSHLGLFEDDVNWRAFPNMSMILILFHKAFQSVHRLWTSSYLRWLSRGGKCEKLINS